MRDLQKVNLLQLYLFWKNLSIAVLLLIALLTASAWTHSIYAIFTAIGSAFIIYWRIYANKTSHHPTYMLVSYALMLSIIIFTVIQMAVSLIQAWHIYEFSEHFSIFKGPRTLSILILAPVCFVTLSVVYLRRKKLHRYLDDKFGVNSDVFLKGKLGAILTRESRIQVFNLLIIFGLLSVINWTYYSFFFYKDAVLTMKDIYIFYWVNVCGLVFFLLYLLVHNYNMDLDLRQSGNLLTPEEVSNLTHKNYFRYFVVCENHLFVSYECEDPDYTAHKVLDTPFFQSRTGRMISEPEIKNMIAKATGVNNGELRFLFSFPAPGLNNHHVSRYFYFLSGQLTDYPQLDESKGEWMTMNRLQEINRKRPHALSSYLLADTNRLLTIMQTKKMYDEHGNRRYKIKSYMPPFRLEDIRTSDTDFQSNKWLDIATFNCDKPFFRLRRLLHTLRRGAKNVKAWMV